MTPMARKMLWVLAFLAAAYAFSFFRTRAATPPPGVNSAVAAGARVASSGGKKPLVEQVVELRSADLERAPALALGSRDPFRFYEPPPPPPPPPPRPRQPTPEEIAAQFVPPPPPPPPPKPQPPPVPFRYLGNFGPKGNTIAVFVEGETIVNAREGDILNGKFRVARIGYESADIEFVDFPDAPAQRLPVGR